MIQMWIKIKNYLKNNDFYAHLLFFDIIVFKEGE